MTELTTTQEQATRARLAAATEGPWAAWTDQDGTRHMSGMLMVGVEAGVIPDGETWVDGADVNNPIAHTYTPEDRELIAHAPTDIAALLAELDRLRAELAKARAVTEDKVEVACKAYYEARADELDDTIRPRWDRLLAVSPDICGVYRTHQRAALTAALGGGGDA